MDWNDEAIARLRALWDEGHSTAEIGRRLGITKNAVVGKAHRLMLSARPSPIRRSSAETSTPRASVARRVSGPTLPELTAPPASRPPIVPTRPEARTVEARRPESARPSPVLRAVPVAPRPATRVVACCWPIGEPGTPSFRFCSDAAMQGRPYCAEHASIAYVRVRDRREDAA